MASKYGLKIRNYRVGSIYEYSLGVRERYHFNSAMFTNNLFLYFLQENGLKEVNGQTRDIIGVNFDYGSKSYDEIRKLTQSKRDESFSLGDEEKAEFFNKRLEIIESNKNLYDKKTADELRELYYQNGIDIEYPIFYKDGTVKKIEIIHYVMLYRSAGKAKQGSCMFINKKLYKRAVDFLQMGIKMPKHNAPIVEMSAYMSLICSSIVDTVTIDPKDILVLKDIDSYYKTNIVSIGINKDKHCIAESINDYTLKNTMFDGQCIIDDSIFPKWGNGSILLRHHMCKMNGVHGHIQLFLRDYFGDKYETATLKDMWGNEHLVKSIKIITTESAMKWLKFGVSYDYWCDRVNANGNVFGIVKTPHKSKLGAYQRMSYQMINALSLDIMPNVVKNSKEYIELLKRDNYAFLDFLDKNKNFSNDYEVLIALCNQDYDFTRSDYFRTRKSTIIQSYVNNFKFGKVLQNGDNLTIVGSPYAMLLYSVGEDVEKDNTFSSEENCIQCFSKRFKDNEYLAEFRSPFNSKNNMGYLHNVYSDNMEKYFDLGEEVIAINMLHTDFQDRNNGSDQDADTIFTTNQKDIVEWSKYCYMNYPTIVNNIPKDKNHYDLDLINYARIDNKLASAQKAIGGSSNLAQLAQTYSYNSSDQKYIDYVCILAVLAQVAIDSAKRSFDIDLNEEIKRIKLDMDIEEMKYPIFWKHIKDKTAKQDQPRFKKEKINKKLECPMNYLIDLKFDDSRSEEETLPISYFFQKFELDTNDKNRRKSKKVEELIEKYSRQLFSSQIDSEDDKDNYLLLMSDFEQLIEDIKVTYISKNYVGLMSWLINRAFNIGSGVKSKKVSKEIKSKIDSNKAILLKTLYNVNPTMLLLCFSKNVKN